MVSHPHSKRPFRTFHWLRRGKPNADRIGGPDSPEKPIASDLGSPTPGKNPLLDFLAPSSNRRTVGRGQRVWLGLPAAGAVGTISP
ncbi:predicted protein [Micromonas commoda]|uniref:Uncharacterized protein n=1 Tax=Micromonas commoda (strain RCC299 / NOUM17 / CCMP2709) TaxID=296587 RepID=C1DY53_MICCC|nr:predicted protein [Micromonas commoda]ACO61366.1 predicted protein [Micromonas commoda]|eukprot:XP_002500108.1 predicted protein [Micromonas commoda]